MVLVEMPNGKTTYAAFTSGKKDGWHGWDGSPLKTEPLRWLDPDDLLAPIVDGGEALEEMDAAIIEAKRLIEDDGETMPSPGDAIQTIENAWDKFRASLTAPRPDDGGV